MPFHIQGKKMHDISVRKIKIYNYFYMLKTYFKTSNLTYFLIQKLWNQDLVNLGFDDNKIRFKTNDYISSVIRQDDFQSGNYKDKSSQREIMKKKKTSKRSVFQDPSFIRFL